MQFRRAIFSLLIILGFNIVAFGESNTAGTVIIPFGDTSRPISLQAQSDSKLLIGGRTPVRLHASQFFLTRYNPDGTLDTTFGNAGKVTTSFNGDRIIQDAWLQDLRILNGGKIIAVGTIFGSPRSGIVFAQYNSDGTLDTSFGDHGKVIFRFADPVGRFYLSSIQIQNNGKIVVAGVLDGRLGGEVHSQFAVARFNSDGSLDSSFGKNGTATIATAGTAHAERLRILSDGKIIVLGNFNFEELVLARLHSNGSLDNTFGANYGPPGPPYPIRGTTKLPLGGRFGGNTLQILSDGKILVSDNWNGPRGYEHLLVRFDSQGKLDGTFGIKGMVKTQGRHHPFYVHKLEVIDNGKLLGVGATFDPNGNPQRNLYLRRLNQDGSLDTTFGNQGEVITQLNNESGLGDIKMQDDGKILALGRVCDPLELHCDFVLARYNSNGSLDTAFGP